MKILILDDERPARSELAYLLSLCAPKAEVLEAQDPHEALALIENHSFDVLFLDINLDSVNGIGFASMIKNKNCNAPIVFATAYGEYAVRAFEVGAIDYIMKPFELSRLEQTMKKVSEHTEQNSKTGIDKISVLGAKSITMVEIKEIIYIETANRSCTIYLKDKKYVSNEALSTFEERLKQHNFFRIHKSFLVNLNYIEEFVPWFNSGYGLRMKHFKENILPIGRSQIKEIRKMFDF